ncbi:hypothetical protein F4810DRAFT_721804 [Camillea tinctor]|nr:hypothetical protein F4810DRAFT_721804 [Camillea tinctor]
MNGCMGIPQDKESREEMVTMAEQLNSSHNNSYPIGYHGPLYSLPHWPKVSAVIWQSPPSQSPSRLPNMAIANVKDLVSKWDAQASSPTPRAAHRLSAKTRQLSHGNMHCCKSPASRCVPLAPESGDRYVTSSAFWLCRGLGLDGEGEPDVKSNSRWAAPRSCKKRMPSFGSVSRSSGHPQRKKKNSFAFGNLSYMIITFPLDI